MKKVLKWSSIIVLVVVGLAASIYFIFLYPFFSKMKQTEVVHVDKNFTIILGGGGNSGIVNSSRLVVVIDSKMDEAAELLHTKVVELAGRKPILLINTHYHPDHCGGNVLYKGQRIMAGNYGEADWIKEAGKESLPTEWLYASVKIPLDDDTLLIFNLSKNVHTSNDVMVFFQHRKLLFTGDVVLNKQAPVLMGVANANAYLETFEKLLIDLDVKTIVPGHGNIGGTEILEEFKNYFSDMKLAASDNSKENELIEKYKDWNQIPIFMSPGATIRHFKKKPQ